MYLGLLITLVISIAVFYDTFLFQVWQSSTAHMVSDVPVHSQFVVKFSQTHSFPVYSLWYRLVHVMTGFSEEYSYIANASILLLAVLVTAKYAVTYWILNKSHTDERKISLIALALIFVMPVISYYSCDIDSVNKSFCLGSTHFYLGNISPNQWHNSTLILAMPFNLLLFYFSVKNIKSKSVYPFLIMGGLSVISILCKPSYALAFLPVLCVSILWLNINSQEFWRSIFKCMLVAIPAFLTLLYQWYFTFFHNEIFESGARTIIAPFFVWSNYSPHIAFSLLLSIAFPLFVLVFFIKKIDFYLIMSWITFLVALLIVITLSEEPNWGAGNYFWGAIASNYVLFLFSVRFILNQPICWKTKVANFVFGVHFVSGCLMLASFFIRQSSLML